MASLVFVPIVLDVLYAFALIGGPILHDIKTKSNKPNDIYTETSDVKDVEDGYMRIICVVQKRTWLRTARFSYQSYSKGGVAYLGERLGEALCGDKSGNDSKVPGIKYATIKVKLESGKNYQVTYGNTGALGIWTFASSTFKINSADIPKVSGRTHYVYFDEGGYFATGDHFYKAKDLF